MWKSPLVVQDPLHIQLHITLLRPTYSNSEIAMRNAWKFSHNSGIVFSVHPFLFLWLWQYLYSVLLPSSNRKYESLAIVRVGHATVCTLYVVIFSCDQAALRTLISVCLSVRLSVCPSVYTPFWQCSCHRIILKFSGVITIDRRDVHAKRQSKRWKVKVSDRGYDPFKLFPDHNSSLNSHMAMKWCTKLEAAWKRCHIVFEGHPFNYKVTRD